MTAAAGASTLRRVISDEDELMMDSMSASSVTPPLAPPLSPCRQRDASSADHPVPYTTSWPDEAGPEGDALHQPQQPSSSESPGQATKPLHRSHEMNRFPSALVGSFDALFSSSTPQIITTAIPPLPPGHNRTVEDDTESITSAHSCGNRDDYNNALAITNDAHDVTQLPSQRSFQSQKSLQSVRSAQSTKSTQSWGQLTEIDLPPKVNDMEAPTYVLEESPSSQNLWKQTAGNRPPQPMEERAFFERMWAENFARSQVQYGVPVQDLVNAAAVAPITIVEDCNNTSNNNNDDATSSDHMMYSSIFSMATPASTRQEDVAEAILVSRMNDMHHGLLTMDSASPMTASQRQLLDKDTTVMLKGINAFGTTVSKSFAQTGRDGLMDVTTVNVSVASYRVVESKRHGRYAQFHVIYREGNMRDTIGVWKRYRDFEMLASKISGKGSCEGCSVLHGSMSSHHVIEPEVEHLPNAVTSWQLMKKRKRWYRCLDAGYLSLKVFLLERFLHDVLFESSSPYLLRHFVLTSVGDDAPSSPNSP